MAGEYMEHWNGHQLIVIDVETTGTHPFWHEIVQISAIALDGRLNIDKNILPFDMYLCPEHPERINPEALEVTGLKLVDLLKNGFNTDKARDMFETWVGTLELGLTPSGTMKRLLPLAHNWAFDKAFVQDWLGYELFDYLFDGRYRDTMVVSLFRNDLAAMHGERVPHSKNKLSWLAKNLDVEHNYAHNSLQDCIVTAKCYRRLCQLGLMV